MLLACTHNNKHCIIFVSRPLVSTSCAILSMEFSDKGQSTVGGCIAMNDLIVGYASGSRIAVFQKLLLWKHIE